MASENYVTRESLKDLRSPPKNLMTRLEEPKNKKMPERRESSWVGCSWNLRMKTRKWSIEDTKIQQQRRGAKKAETKTRNKSWTSQRSESRTFGNKDWKYVKKLHRNILRIWK